MARISKFKLSEHVLAKIFDLFFEIVGRNKNKDEFKRIIHDLLSSTERIMIAKRIAIIYLRLKNIDQRTICKVLKISTATVAKFSLLMEKSDGIVPTFNKIMKNEKIIEFLEDIFNTLFAPGVPGVNWKAAWERKIARDRQKTLGM